MVSTSGSKNCSASEIFCLEAPAASSIHNLSSEKIKIEGLTSFEIVKSENTSDAITDVSPDIAVCDHFPGSGGGIAGVAGHLQVHLHHSY